MSCVDGVVGKARMSLDVVGSNPHTSIGDDERAKECQYKPLPSRRPLKRPGGRETGGPARADGITVCSQE